MLSVFTTIKLNLNVPNANRFYGLINNNYWHGIIAADVRTFIAGY